ncbi:MAG: BolA family transcriptional regulator [Deltaproteobacteria bacterium]|nr:BolA family transcriptional regulator [Deltaproteobacteria bacterium]
MTTADIIIAKIKEQLPSAQIRATDLTGGGDHWQLVVRAAEFKGKGLIEQHQMIYRALGDMMRQEIHALSLDTKEA